MFTGKLHERDISRRTQILRKKKKVKKDKKLKNKQTKKPKQYYPLLALS